MASSSANRKSESVRFMLDGQVVTVDAALPTMTLLQYLRETLGRTGTKEGCAEGDCGACTVVLGEWQGGRIAYRAVNSCIRFLPTVDGKEVITVESLAAADGSPHPVQQAMVDCHASQCGFCTPGFVMSLLGLYLNCDKADREQVVDTLSGNLCRCTGYRPIIEAACRMHEYPQPLTWSRSDAQSRGRRARLQALQRDGSLRVASGAGFHAPRTIDELADAYLAAPQSLLLAGGTDVGLWVTKQLRDLPPLIYIGEVAELKRVLEAGGAIEIGAAVSLADGYDAIVTRYPMLAELANRFASIPVRNAGTLCGNLANGSPIGDTMPILIALGATVELRCGNKIRSLPLEDLYLGYQKKALAPGEFIAAARVPLPKAGCIVASYKVSKRFDQDISAVCGAYAIELERDTIRGARIAYGGMAPIPRRATQAEAALIGAQWNEATIGRAQAALARDYLPIGDMRASARYRSQVASNLLQRLFLEHGEGGTPCRLSMSVEAVTAD